jgi:hypothetical protein
MTAIILPACNEAVCLPLVLDELIPIAKELGCVIAVGLNDCSDHSASVMLDYPQVFAGHTSKRGYGHGCLAAIQALNMADIHPSAFIFMAADGANDPALLSCLLQHHAQGADLVIGQRTLLFVNFNGLGVVRMVSNLLIASWASLLSGRLYADLGPQRLVSQRLLQTWATLGQDREWGWTIEPQIIAPMLGMGVHTVTARERPRLAGEQKVTGVSWWRSAQIGWMIAKRGWKMWHLVKRHAASMTQRQWGRAS